MAEADGGHREDGTASDVLDGRIHAKAEDEEEGGETSCVAEANVVILLFEVKKKRMVVKQQCRDRVMVVRAR